MSKTPTSILDLTPSALAEAIASFNDEPYRPRQVMEWIYRHRASSFEEMTNLPKELRSSLASRYSIFSMTERQVLRSPRDGTTKYLLELADGELVESVYMPDRERRTVCISSQVGCAMGCAFCATGQIGFRRNLSSAEILEQILRIARDHGGVSNVVFMGMGEPLLNIRAVLAAVAALTDPERMGLAPRRITISTCGIVPGILKLAQPGIGVRLALSVGSADDEERSRLMPINRKYPLAQVVEACERFLENAPRSLTLEYVLMADVNDSSRHARLLTKLAKKLAAKVNLIPHNPVRGCGFRPPRTADVLRFRNWLRVCGIEVAIRFRRGRDIEAACGQLRAAAERGSGTELGQGEVREEARE